MNLKTYSQLVTSVIPLNVRPPERACAATEPGLRPTREARKQIVAISHTAGGGGISVAWSRCGEAERDAPDGPRDDSGRALACDDWKRRVL